MASFTDPRVTEKRFLAIPPQQLTANGTTDGVLTLSNTYGWKVGQIVTVISNTVQPRRLKIKAVISETEIKVGDISSPIYKFSNVSDLLTADNAMVELVDDTINSGSQASNRRPVIDLHEIQRQVYEEEPTVALRSHLVDWLGRSYDVTNPMPVRLSDGDVNIGTVNAEIEVQLSRIDNNPDAGDVHDSVRIGNQDYEATYTTNDTESKAALDIMMLNKLIDIPHDDIEVTQFTADGDPEIIEIRDNGQLKRTLTLTYNADGEFQRVQRS